MPTMNTTKGVLLILGIANLLAFIVLAVISSYFNLTDFAGSFSVALLIECVFCFAVAAVGGFSVPTGRVQGDKDPSHYTHDTWTGGGKISDSPAFLISGAILLMESLLIGFVIITL